MKRALLIGLLLISFALMLAGCGETLNGISKDVKRMGKGVKTIFVREAD